MFDDHSMLQKTCDVLIIGAGAGGLTAAVTAAHAGLKVVVVEKSAWFGGSTALSGGWIWIPCNPVAEAEGHDDDPARAELYVRHHTGAYFQPEQVRSYLANGPEMVRFLQENTEVQFLADRTFADYFPDDPGGSKGGRSLVAKPFDGRALGDRLKNLRPPLKQQTFLGMLVGSGAHLKHFLNATKSFRSAAIVLRSLAGYGFDLLRYGRGVKLYNGNALMGRLAKAALDNGVTILLSTPAVGLEQQDGVATGALVESSGRTIRIEARRGVILASGGFPHDPEKRRRYFPKEQTVSIAPEENAGDGARMAAAMGAVIQERSLAPAYTAVFSKHRNAGGETLLYPHFMDRAKPGIIAVDSSGRRFCNESNSYHDVAQEMIRQGIDGVEKRAFFLADHRAVRKYGLGAARPFPLPLRPHLRSGYLTRAQTLGDLAARLGLPSQALSDELEQFNRYAASGSDPKFRRGESAYNAFQGDYEHTPNPCLAPLATPPFYAVEIHAGDFGPFIGLRINPDAQVLDAEGRAIPRLYAAGNDAANVFSGACLGGGITIGPAMVFGYIAGKSVSRF
ncbi:FAD-dependent oxidoreductase [Rhodobacter sp. SGA-6-6]|nr:FAD-dependent oxidoreductase [Rhodobacter sp. SGA-6-6]